MLTGRSNGRADRLAGRLLASLDYGQIDEIVDDLPAFLQAAMVQCGQIDAALRQEYIAYPADSGLAV